MWVQLLIVFLLFIGVLYFESLFNAYRTIIDLVHNQSLFELAYFESRIGRFLRRLASFVVIVILKPSSPFMINILLNNMDDDFRSRVFGQGLGSLVNPGTPISPEDAEAMILDAARRFSELGTRNMEEVAIPKRPVTADLLMSAVTEISGNSILQASETVTMGSIFAATLTNLSRNANRLMRKVNSNSNSNVTSPRGKRNTQPEPLAELLSGRSILYIPFEMQGILVARGRARQIRL